MMSFIFSICFFYIHGFRSNIYFTPNNMFNALLFCLFIEFYATIHNSMVCYSKALHSYFLGFGNKLFNFTRAIQKTILCMNCLLYTSDAADEEDSVDLGGRRIIKKKK